MSSCHGWSRDTHSGGSAACTREAEPPQEHDLAEPSHEEGGGQPQGIAPTWFPLIFFRKCQFYLNLYPSIYRYNPWIYCNFTAIYTNFEPGF